MRGLQAASRSRHVVDAHHGPAPQGAGPVHAASPADLRPRCPTPGGGSWPWANATLIATGQAPVQAHIAAARLRLAARITARGTPAGRGLAQSWSGAGWRKALVRDMQVMHAVLRERLRELPDPAVAPTVWEDLWRKYPGPWNGLVRKMVMRAAEDPRCFPGGYCRWRQGRCSGNSAAGWGLRGGRRARLDCRAQCGGAGR